MVLDDFSNSKPRTFDVLKSMVDNRVMLAFIKGDVRNSGLVEQLINYYAIKSVVHFAAVKSVSESMADPLKYFNINVCGLASLLSAMQATETKNLVFSSSCTVYGDSSHLPLKECSPRNSINPYGLSKIMCEEMLETLCSKSTGWHVTSLRYFNPIGAHPSGCIFDDPLSKSPSVIPSLLRVVSGHEPFFGIFGSDYNTADGTAVRDYIHVVDLANSHVAALNRYSDLTTDRNTHPIRSEFCPINVGLGEGVSVLELIHYFESAASVSIPTKILPRRTGDAGTVFCDNTKVKEILPEWKPKFTVSDACFHAYQASRKNGNNY